MVFDWTTTMAIVIIMQSAISFVMIFLKKVPISYMCSVDRAGKPDCIDPSFKSMDKDKDIYLICVVFD